MQLWPPRMTLLPYFVVFDERFPTGLSPDGNAMYIRAVLKSGCEARIKLLGMRMYDLMVSMVINSRMF